MAKPLVPSSSFQININLLKFIGNWPYNGPFAILYYIYGQIVYFGTSVFFVLHMAMYVVKVWGNIQEIADGSFLLFEITSLIFKAGLLNFPATKKLIEHVDSAEFKVRNEYQNIYIKEAMYITRRNSFIFNGVCTTVCWCINIIPLLAGAYKMKVLPIKGWFPFATNISPYYEIAYTYQFFAVWFGALLHCSLDGIITGTLTHACGQLQVLKDSLRTLRSRALVQLNLLKIDTELCQQCNNGPTEWMCDNEIHLHKGKDILEEEVFLEMLKCIKHHQAIIEYVENVQIIFRNSLFAQFSCSAFAICVTAFEISIIKPFTVDFVVVVCFMINIIYQLFFYCWYGNELFVLSTTINEDVYKSDWYYFGPRVKKLMFIMMERSKVPMIISAGHIFQLTLETFTSIMKSAYSFYTVLNQMEINTYIGVDQ